jgi:carbon monoxide dehydrogenase subunit G
MSFQIEDKFQVKAPIDRVWNFLIDPRQVVQCLPGVKLTEIKDDRTFVGAMTVKIGPVSMSFAGTVQITEKDEAQHRVRMSGEGKEGSGWVKGSMFSQLVSLSAGETEIQMQTELEIAGKALQFGRGLIQPIMKQQFQKFAESVKKILETPQ